MHNGVLVLLIALLDGSSLHNTPARLDNVQLHQAVESSPLVLNSIELLLVQPVDVTDVSQPRVKNAQVGRGQGSLDAAAVVVAADDNVLDLQVAHGVVDHGHGGKVDGGDDVGDVAVDEDLAGIEAHDFVRGDTAVGAANVPGCRNESNALSLSLLLYVKGRTYRYSGDWPAASLSKNWGSAFFFEATQARLLSKIFSWDCFR